MDGNFSDANLGNKIDVPLLLSRNPSIFLSPRGFCGQEFCPDGK